MAKFRLTLHAAEMLAARGIEDAVLEDALDNPDVVHQDRGDESLENWYKVLQDHEGRVLKAVVRKDGDTLVVVTAYFDRSMRGKT